MVEGRRILFNNNKCTYSMENLCMYLTYMQADTRIRSVCVSVWYINRNNLIIHVKGYNVKIRLVM